MIRRNDESKWAVLAVVGIAVCLAGWVLELVGRHCAGAIAVTLGAASAAALVAAISRRTRKFQVWVVLLLLIVIALSRAHAVIACLR